MKTTTLKQTLHYLLILSLGLSILGCKNDSDSGSSGAASSLVSITASNQQAVTASLFESIDLTSPQLPLSDATTSSNSDLAKILPSYIPYQAPTLAGDVYSCKDGGSIRYSADKLSMTYDDCQELGATTNGQMNVAYDATTATMTYTLTDYSFTNDKKEYTTTATTYTVSGGNISFNSNGKTTVDGKSIEFSDYNYTLSLVDNKLDISVGGKIKTSDLGNWVELKTLSSMQFLDSSCPITGKVQLKGNNSILQLHFRNDQSVDSYLNGNVESRYSNCSKVPLLAGI